MKRIGIDARLYFQTGVGVYLRNFLHYLQELDTKDIEFYIYIMRAESDRIQFKRSNFIKKGMTHNWHSLSEQTGFLKKLYDDRLDLMHFTYFSYPILYRKKFIATIHDTILLQHKTGKASTKNSLHYELKYHAAKLAFSQQVRNSAKVITPSKTVKKELVDIFGKRYEHKIVSIYEGFNYELMTAKEDNLYAKVFKRHDFFMYIGNFYPHKNVERLIHAFAQVKTDKQLILIGGEDYFMRRLDQLITSLKQVKRIVFFHRLTTDQLAYFYKNALALIHPSLAEGFCLPLIEASHFKLPIIASDIPVFKEIIGDEYQAFDPTSVESIAQSIEKFLHSNHHASASLPHDYSFAKMTRDILSLYHSV